MADHRFLPTSLNRGVAWLLALGVLLALPACDSDGDTNNLDVVDGSYTATQFRFDANNTDDFDVNLLGQFGTPPRLEIVAEDQFFLLRYGQQSLRGSVSRSSGELRFDVGQGDPSRLLLPSNEGTDFRMQLQDDGDALVGGRDGEGIVRLEVDLRDYGVDQRSVDGRLLIRFERQ